MPKDKDKDKHHPWEKYLHFDDDGCLVVTDSSLGGEFRKYWSDDTEEFCVKLEDDGGGHGHVDSLCTCRRSGT
jgi:hypothetical protein